MWLGETGSAQAGGQAGVSGRWAGALWWLDQLASLSTIGHEVQCRQTLSGSDYGLLSETTLEPTPEFWVFVLWRRLMGTRVYAAVAEGAPSTLRTYCHSDGGATAAQTATSRRAGRRGASAARSCLLINLGDSALTVHLGGWVGAALPRAQVWMLEARSLDAAQLTINGVVPATLDEDGTIPDLHGVEGAADGTLTVGPKAAAFVRLSV